MEGFAVFFDIGNTLASGVVERGTISCLDVYPSMPEILKRLRTGEVRSAVGVISSTGDENAATMNKVLDAAGLSSLVDAGLCLSPHPLHALHLVESEFRSHA